MYNLLRQTSLKCLQHMPLLVGVILCLALSWPLLDLTNVFYNDWTNHVWMMGYIGEFFKQHHSFSPVINTNQMVGINIPIFYGFGFYPLNGLVSAIIGNVLAIRLLVVFLFALQYVSVFSICKRLSANPVISCVIAVLATTAIYSITNVYTRSGITEFVGIACLICALCSLIGMLFLRQRLLDSVCFGLLYVGSALTHPLSATFGMAFFACFGLICLPFCRQKKQVILAAVAVVAALVCVLSPWLLAIGLFGKLVHIASENINVLVFTRDFFFPQTLDSIWNRLAPFPLDPRCITAGIHGISAPYMYCQINMPLLLLSIGMAAGLVFAGVRRRHNLLHVVATTAFCALGAFALLMSVCPQLTLLMGNAFVILQFAYRLVAFVNLAALGLAISLLAIYGPSIKKAGAWLAPLLAVSLTLAITSVMIILVYAQSTCSKQAFDISRLSSTQAELLEVPRLMTAMSDYPVWKGFGAGIPAYMPSLSIHFKVGQGKDFGTVAPYPIEVAKYTLVRTNVLTFPWNKILIDGQEVPQHLVNIHLMKINAVETPALAINVPPGRHVIEYQFKPKKLWPQLLALSWFVLCSWVLLCVALLIKSARTRDEEFSTDPDARSANALNLSVPQPVGLPSDTESSVVSSGKAP